MSEAPFFAGAVHGVRTWQVDDDLSLRGIGTGSAEPWIAGGRVTTAACLRQTHSAPHPDCRCGLYALHTFTPPLDRVPLRREWPVIGVVEAWGRVEVHATGFRAEIARPKVLFAPARHLVSGEHLEKLEEVAGRYLVPLVELPQSHLAREWCRRRGLGLSREVIETVIEP